ncbi:MAG: hypothetical protein IH604_03600, partial [Burkholderiales bacterium]|nr:hypothetical protein [Burkholderiales bacterium]
VYVHNKASGNITLGKAITAQGGAGGNGAVVTVWNEDTAGTIAVDAAIEASSNGSGNGGTIQLVSAGASSAITQTGTTTATALLATGAVGGSLKIKSAGAVTLQNPTNDVQTLAATISTANKDFSYKDANSLDVSTVAAAGSLTAPSGTGASQAAMDGITTDGNVTVTALGSGDLTVSKDIIKSATTAATTLTLQANRNIIFNSGADAKLGSGASGTYTMVLNSDLDQATVSGGAIQLNSGTVLSSNGGSITLGGGASPSTTPAIGQGPLVEGILINGAQLQSGTGNIILNGTGLASGTNAHGIRIANSGVVQSSSGSITMTGIGGAGNNDGVLLDTNSSILSSSGAIQVKGTRTGSGVDINTTGGGNIIGGATASASSSDILLEAVGTSGIRTDATIGTSGSTTLRASSGGAITQTGGSILATGGANSALRLLGNAVTSTVANLSSTTNDINGLVVDLSGATSKLSYRDANGFNIGSLSKPITQGGGSVNHDGITVGTAAGAGNNTLTLNAFGAVTQSQKITAGAMQLLGGTSVSYTLTNALNDITTLAASTAGSISYRDANSYAVGSVSSTNYFSVATIPTGGSTNGTTETGSAGSYTATTVGIHTTAGGTVQLDVPGTLTINNDINTDGSFAQISSAGTGAVSISSPRSISTTGDAVSFASPVALNGAGTTTIDTTTGSSPAGANVTFSNTLTGTTNSAENLTITAGSGGAVAFNGSVGAIRLGDVNITQARDVTVQSTFTAKTLTQSQGATGAPSTTPSVGATTINGAVNTTGNTSLATSGALNVSGTGSIAAGAGSTVTLTTGGDMTLSGSVTAPAGATLNVIGTDRILTQNGGTLSTTNSAIALIADEMMLTSAINSGSGAVTLKPNNTSDAIQLGVAAANTNNSAATLELSDSEVNTITTTGGLTIGASNHVGAITVVGALTPTTAQNGLTLINNTGGIAINAQLTYAAGNGNLTLTANGGGVSAGAITTSGAALDVNGVLAMNAATGVGTLASPMVLSHGAGTNMTVTNTTSGGVFVRADIGDLNVTSIENSAAVSGGVNLNVGTNLNINGTVQNTRGNIQFVTGNDTAYTAAGGFGLSPASVATGTLGAVNIKGRVIAKNAGAISIFSTGAVTQSIDVAAGLQSGAVVDTVVNPDQTVVETVTQGALKVYTFNSGAQTGTISLVNDLADTGNSMGPITLEARLAGSIKPPPYAESNIEYKSVNGTKISGIGTAADFSLVAPSQTIDLVDGATLSGANVNLIATAGDVVVKSAITNAQVNDGQSGGSLNLYATGNIILNNPDGSSAGVVIGKDLGTLDAQGDREFEKFDHQLTLVATGDIRIYGTVQVTGDLALRANASASEASGPGGVAGYGAGAGSVIIAGSAGNPVEVRAQNIVVGVKDASGNPLPVQNLIIDNSANAADSGKFMDSTLRADHKLDIYLNGDQGGPGTSGNFVITGGTATATSGGPAVAAAKSSALAVARGEVVTILGVKGGEQLTNNPDRQTVNPALPYTTNSSSIVLQAGTATSNTAAGGGALAAADAIILGTVSKFIDIGGNIEMTGGVADSKDGGQTSAAAKIDPPNLWINTGGYIKIIGGEGAGARAAIVNSGDMEINIGGKFDYTYTDATGTHTVKDVGLLLVGGIGSGLYDRDNQPIELYYDVSSQVLLLFPAINGGPGGGKLFQYTDKAKASAYIQSLSPRGFDDSLLAYIIFAANEETRTGRISTSTSNADDANKPSCN